MSSTVSISSREGRRGLAALLVGGILLALSASAGSPQGTGGVLYTNVAGQTVRGPVQRVDGDRVWFNNRSYPLTIFPPGEQKRIIRAAGYEILPQRDPDAVRRDAFFENLLKRQDALEKIGATTHERAETQRALIRRAWKMAEESDRK